jgi:hypothetical protein
MLYFSFIDQSSIALRQIRVLIAALTSALSAGGGAFRGQARQDHLGEMGVATDSPERVGAGH